MNYEGKGELDAMEFGRDIGIAIDSMKILLSSFPVSRDTPGIDREYNERRKRLKEAIELIERATAVVEEIKDEEQEALENLPENLQESERADNMQECIDLLEEIQGDLE
ncbi:hypothetical protein QE152_g38908 [Popillia japonica]|uniref:Mediator of RNA polymerase II transcription subunit 21 n=1 Tax=Popillia japonica TaxID=7064 RepID=A0AAW1HW25_POPJA